MDQEQVEKSRREQLAFERELFEQKLKFNQQIKANHCQSQVTWKDKSKAK